ncbi:MAG: FecR family protein [Gemmatimonadales bacterium]
MHEPSLDDLILRSLTDQLSELEERQLRKWLQADPANERRYEELTAAWRLEPARRRPLRPPPNPDGLIRSAERRRAATRAAPSLGRGQRRWLVGLAAAALVAAAGWQALERRGNAPIPEPFRAEEFTTRPNETVTVRLSDGSYVRLAPSSTVRIEPGYYAREVVLRGRAFFAVASDPARPFLVRTALGTARALGTQFEVRTEGDRLRLAVVEGRVALTSGQSTVEVGESEVGHARAGGAPNVMTVENIYDLLRFPGGLLVYQTMPLTAVARELEYHFRVRITIADSGLARREFTGSFANESFDEVLTSICRAVGADCSVSDDRAVIAPRTSTGR